MDQNAADLMIVTRFIFCVIIAFGGILALYFGFHLYRKGTGLKPDGTTVDWGKVKFSLQTVGGVVMATSLGWAFVAEQSLPKFAQFKDGAVSVTVNSPGKTPTTIYPNAIHVANWTDNSSLFSTDPGLVEKDFRIALTNSPAIFHIDKGAEDFEEVSVKLDKTNKTLNALFENKNETIDVLYEPKPSANGLMFVPSSATAKEKLSLVPQIND